MLHCFYFRTNHRPNKTQKVFIRRTGFAVDNFWPRVSAAETFLAILVGMTIIIISCNRFLTDLMDNSELIRNVALIGHLHHGKVCWAATEIWGLLRFITREVCIISGDVANFIWDWLIWWTLALFGKIKQSSLEQCLPTFTQSCKIFGKSALLQYALKVPKDRDRVKTTAIQSTLCCHRLYSVPVFWCFYCVMN